MQVNRWLRILEHQLMLSHDFVQNFLRFVDISFVADTKLKVHTPFATARDIGDDITPDGIVRHNHQLVVGCHDSGCHQGHRFDLSDYSGDIHPVVHVKRFVKQNHETCCVRISRLTSNRRAE